MNKLFRILLIGFMGFSCAPMIVSLAGEGLTLPGVTKCIGLSDSGTACQKNTGTSGATVPLLSTANTWTLTQSLSAALSLSDGLKTAPSLLFTSDPTVGFFHRAAGIISVALDANKSSFEMLNSGYGVNEGLRIANGFALGASGTDFSTTGPDVYFLRIASDIGAMQRSTAAQEWRTYGTTTGPKYTSMRHDGTNGLFDTNSGTLKIGSTGALTTIGQGYAVGSLPTGVIGAQAWVTDQLTACPVLSGTFTGGGSVVCKAFYNGTAWVHE